MAKLKYLFTTIFILLLTATPINAQADLDVTEPKVIIQDEQTAAAVVYQKERLQEEIETVRDTLRGQIDTYRKDYKAYQIAKSQYEKLNTLASIEEAIQKSKTAMYSRNQVLITYFTLLRLTLIEMDGVELSQKDQILNQIETHLTNLENHNKDVEKITTREDLAQMKLEFLPLADFSEQTAYQSLSLIAVGKLQAVYDKAIVIQEKLKKELTDKGSKIQQAERKRAFDETDKVLVEAKEQLDEVWLELKESSKKSGKKAQSIYDRLNQDLTPIFAKLSKSVSYLNQLLKT